MIKGMHLTAIGAQNVLLEPGAGLDPSDPDVYLEPLLRHLQTNNAERLLYDLSDVPVIDDVYYDWLLRLNTICKFANIELVTVNISPAVAYALSAIINADPPFTCALNVKEAS